MFEGIWVVELGWRIFNLPWLPWKPCILQRSNRIHLKAYNQCDIVKLCFSGVGWFLKNVQVKINLKGVFVSKSVHRKLLESFCFLYQISICTSHSLLQYGVWSLCLLFVTRWEAISLGHEFFLSWYPVLINLEVALVMACLWVLCWYSGDFNSNFVVERHLESSMNWGY